METSSSIMKEEQNNSLPFVGSAAFIKLMHNSNVKVGFSFVLEIRENVYQTPLQIKSGGYHGTTNEDKYGAIALCFFSM